MKRLAVAAVCLVLAWLAVPVPLSRAYAQSEKVTRIRMTIGELRAQGIAVSPNASSFPNSCQSSGNARLSVSNELLAHFNARGFTLESVCLAFSSHMRFDPETGRQLPLAFVPEIRADGFDNEFPLTAPLCFRDGVSHLECDFKFDTWWGAKLDRGQLAEHRQFAQRVDTMVRALIRDNGLSGVFWRLSMSQQSRFPVGSVVGS